MTPKKDFESIIQEDVDIQRADNHGKLFIVRCTLHLVKQEKERSFSNLDKEENGWIKH